MSRSLLPQLREFIDRPFEDLPKIVRLNLQKAASVINWDLMTPGQRQEFIAFLDAFIAKQPPESEGVILHEANCQAEFEIGWDLYDEIEIAKEKVKEISEIKPETVVEARKKERDLEAAIHELDNYENLMATSGTEVNNPMFHVSRNFQDRKSVRENMLLLIYAMAVEKYDYAPGSARSNATGNGGDSIGAALERLGIGYVDRKTIDKYLSEGDALYQQAMARQSTRPGR